jgi:hypothetical protein
MIRSLVVHQVNVSHLARDGEELRALSDEEVTQLHVMVAGVTMDNAALTLQLQRMADQLKEAQSTIAALVQRDEADDAADVTSGYDVCDEVISVIPRSYFEVPPLFFICNPSVLLGSASAFK